jgi:hypothetical protein
VGGKEGRVGERRRSGDSAKSQLNSGQVSVEQRPRRILLEQLRAQVSAEWRRGKILVVYARPNLGRVGMGVRRGEARRKKGGPEGIGSLTTSPSLDRMDALILY